jgi:hypothetical protein
MYIKIKIQVVTVEIKFVHMEYFQIAVVDQTLSEKDSELADGQHILDILSMNDVGDCANH